MTTRQAAVPDGVHSEVLRRELPARAADLKNGDRDLLAEWRTVRARRELICACAMIATIVLLALGLLETAVAAFVEACR